MPTVYPSLAIGARSRLALFKREASQTNWVRPMTWRDVRFATLRSSPGLGQGFNDKTPVWYSQDGRQFRRERDASDIVNLRHTGYYTNEFCDETTRGIVVALPHGRFIAGYLMTMNDERVYFPEVFDDERDAARMADEHARVIAEQECEYQIAERERQAAEDAETEERERELDQEYRIGCDD